MLFDCIYCCVFFQWVPHQPISFVNPNMPPLSLSPDERAEIYARTAVFRELNKTSTVQSFPNYPVNFSRGLVGQNAIMTSYGDVVRIYFSCAEPYGPGCAVSLESTHLPLSLTHKAKHHTLMCSLVFNSCNLNINRGQHNADASKKGQFYLPVFGTTLDCSSPHSFSL
jgi:hypothetical protein